MTDRTSMFASLRVRNYRLFASGQVVSLSGTWMQRVAQDWLVLNLSHNSGTAIGTGTSFAAATGNTAASAAPHMSVAATSIRPPMSVPWAITATRP